LPPFFLAPSTATQRRAVGAPKGCLGIPDPAFCGHEQRGSQRIGRLCPCPGGFSYERLICAVAPICPASRPCSEVVPLPPGVGGAGDSANGFQGADRALAALNPAGPLTPQQAACTTFSVEPATLNVQPGTPARIGCTGLMPAGERFHLTDAHGEGRYSAWKAGSLQSWKRKGQVVLRANSAIPMGSIGNVAGSATRRPATFLGLNAPSGSRACDPCWAGI